MKSSRSPKRLPITHSRLGNLTAISSAWPPHRATPVVSALKVACMSLMARNVS
eukprot:CAMPEP_0182547396 /NCGR_PEP_ID=MMETSP1323-20130603/37399_1 /TAXON_ID=236787 /ORGANISM="Florenciella parvula, Strain RCC1693" /LENGTH=52 /DNA_ID=CAMNT_0024758703 /DNA_START=136 /DNA_END=291 /DNA_ORIENTATION=+